jgi:hypothetical protein
MPAPHPTSLLSIKPAFVKAGEVVVPVMIHVGEWAELSATPGMWDRIQAEVAAAQARTHKPGPKVGQRGLPKTPITKPGTGKLL